MAYTVKSIFYSLQGEGIRAGRAAVFCRFSGCNLSCSFCDTGFDGTDGPGGGVYPEAQALAASIMRLWPGGYHANPAPYVICTGGEPLLQLDSCLIEALHAHGAEVAVETNGTLAAPEGVDWVCMSPKSGDVVLRSGDELKLLFPQEDAQPDQFEGLDFRHFCLQPVDTGKPARTAANTRLAIEYCLEHPLWRLSLQIHKRLGIP